MKTGQNTNHTTQNGETLSTITEGNDTVSPIDLFIQTLLQPEQWKIIEYKRLLPTLMLLQGYNNWSHCLKLLSDCHIELQEKEAHIDIRKFSLKIQQILY